MKTLALFLCLCLPLHAAIVYETTFEGEADPSTYAQFADSTDQACSGSESAKTTHVSGAMAETTGVDVGALWWGAYIYLTSLPSGTVNLSFSRETDNDPSCLFRLNSDGTVQAKVFAESYVTSTATLSTGVWQLVEFKCDTTQSGSSDIAEIRVNETVVLSTTSTSTRQLARIEFFELSPPTAATYYEDFYIDDAGYRGYSAGCGDVSGGSSKRKALVVGDD